MKQIQADLQIYIDDNVKAQFDFGARLVVYPRVDRWDDEGKRLQSIKADGSLFDAWSYTWQPATAQGDKWVALHIEDFNFNPAPMSELYPAEYLDEQYGEGFTEEYGHLSSTEYVTQYIIDTDENITTVNA